jgi:GGDEF domain-containing protein
VITPLGEAPAGAAGLSGTPGVALTPQAGLNVDLATARRLEAEGNIESAVAAYISIAASDSDDRRDGTMPMSVSVGCTVRQPRDASAVEVLLERADQALRDSKAAGRNRVRVAS